MTTNSTDDQSRESNAGAAKNDNSNETLRNAVRKNAGHPGDASHAAGMRHEPSESDRPDSGPGPARDAGQTDPTES